MTLTRTTFGALTAGLLIAAPIAFAAPAMAAQDDTRWEGTLVDTTTKFVSRWLTNPNNIFGDVTDSSTPPSEADLAGSPQFSGPTVGNAGSINWLNAGLCIQTAFIDPSNTNGVPVTAAPCNGSPEQTWVATASTNGISFTSEAFPNQYLWLHSTGMTTAGGPGANLHSFSNNAIRPLEIADLVVTSPAPSETVAPGDVTFAGTGEPGANVTITDGDGNTVGVAVIDDEGNWRAEIAVGNGPHDFHVTDGTTTIDVSVVGTDSTEGSPIINAAVALGVLAAGAAGMTLTTRRRKADSAV